MPTIAEHFAQPDAMQLRILLYGPSQTKKTYWAGGAATAGFNVLYLDCDGNPQTLKNLSAAAQQRITYLNISDKFKESTAAWFMTRLLKGDPFSWDWRDRKVILPGQKSDTRIDLAVSNLTRNDVIVLDSWTSYTWSLAMQFATENQIDLSQASKPEWEGYRWCGALATWALQQLKALPCHVIIIAHQDVYEKRVTTTDAQGKKEQKVEWSRIQVKSTSGAHAMQVAKAFTDVFYFYLHNSTVKIDTAAAQDRDGGSRLVPGKVWNWDQFQFTDVCKLSGIPLPNGVQTPALAAVPPVQTSSAPASPAPTSNLSALFSKK